MSSPRLSPKQISDRLRKIAAAITFKRSGRLLASTVHCAMDEKQKKLALAALTMMAEIVSKSGAEGFEHLFPELNFEEEINGEYPAHIEASLQIMEAIEAARMLVKTR